MLSGPLDWLTSKTSWLVNDADIVEAVNNTYSAICYNKDKSSPLFCDYNVQDVSNIVWSYINYFITHPEGDTAKYYYDEYSDRSDPYRKLLVEKIAAMASTSSDFTNKVLAYMYWAVKRDKLQPYILQPRQAEKFFDENYWYSGAFGGFFKFTQDFCKSMMDTLKKIGYILTVAVDAAGNIIEGVANTVGAAGTALKYLPYILGFSVAGIAGLQIWSVKKRGKFIVPPIPALMALNKGM